MIKKFNKFPFIFKSLYKSTFQHKTPLPFSNRFYAIKREQRFWDKQIQELKHLDFKEEKQSEGEEEGNIISDEEELLKMDDNEEFEQMEREDFELINCIEISEQNPKKYITHFYETLLKQEEVFVIKNKKDGEIFSFDLQSSIPIYFINWERYLQKEANIDSEEQIIPENHKLEKMRLKELFKEMMERKKHLHLNYKLDVERVITIEEVSLLQKGELFSKLENLFSQIPTRYENGWFNTSILISKIEKKLEQEDRNVEMESACKRLIYLENSDLSRFLAISVFLSEDCNGKCNSDEALKYLNEVEDKHNAKYLHLLSKYHSISNEKDQAIQFAFECLSLEPSNLDFCTEFCELFDNNWDLLENKLLEAKSFKSFLVLLILEIQSESFSNLKDRIDFMVQHFPDDISTMVDYLSHELNEKKCYNEIYLYLFPLFDLPKQNFKSSLFIINSLIKKNKFQNAKYLIKKLKVEMRSIPSNDEIRLSPDYQRILDQLSHLKKQITFLNPSTSKSKISRTK